MEDRSLVDVQETKYETVDKEKKFVIVFFLQTACTELAVAVLLAVKEIVLDEMN